MNKKESFIFWILKKIKKRIPALVIMAAANLFNAFLSVLFALQTKNVIDCAITGQKDALIQACILLVANVVITILTTLVGQHLRDRLDADIDRDLKKEVMHIILRSDYQEISSYHSGELVNRLNNDVRVLGNGLISIFPSFVTLLFRLVATAIVLNQMASYFTWILLGIIFAIAGAATLVQRKMKELHKQVSMATGRVSGFLQEAIEKLIVVKGLNVVPEIEKRADVFLEERWLIQRRRKNISLAMSGGINIMSHAVSICTLLWCAFNLMDGKISYGDVTAITQLSSQLSLPVLMLPSMIPQLIAMAAASERLMELQNVRQETIGSGMNCDFESICARDVDFSYGRALVLNKVSFDIPKGGITAIVGASGIGKSTLLKLLLGLYVPQSGSLTIQTKQQNIPVSSKTRQLFAYAPQGNLLLSGTIRDNILIAKPQATEEELQQAIYVSGMDDYLADLPLGLDTPIGESGTGLSEGQGQRLSLARAILSGAPILLLDEVTSALDAETERKVLSRIRQLHDRTCIVVTHRPAVLDLADQELRVYSDRIEARALNHISV